MALTSEERWAEREARWARQDTYWEAKRIEHREAHVAIVERVMPRAQAEAAVDALLADGVVFARMGPSRDAD